MTKNIRFQVVELGIVRRVVCSEKEFRQVVEIALDNELTLNFVRCEQSDVTCQQFIEEIEANIPQF